MIKRILSVQTRGEFKNGMMNKYATKAELVAVASFIKSMVESDECVDMVTNIVNTTIHYECFDVDDNGNRAL